MFLKLCRRKSIARKLCQERRHVIICAGSCFDSPLSSLLLRLLPFLSLFLRNNLLSCSYRAFLFLPPPLPPQCHSVALGVAGDSGSARQADASFLASLLALQIVRYGSTARTWKADVGSFFSVVFLPCFVFFCSSTIFYWQCEIGEEAGNGICNSRGQRRRCRCNQRRRYSVLQVASINRKGSQTECHVGGFVQCRVSIGARQILCREAELPRASNLFCPNSHRRQSRQSLQALGAPVSSWRLRVHC